jgi:hypothetical protein
VAKQIEKKPTKKKPVLQKQSKDGKFDICGISRKVPKKCSCDYCRGRIVSFILNDSLATKLNVKYVDRNIVKAKGAKWSEYEKVWLIPAINPNYKELVDKF